MNEYKVICGTCKCKPEIIPEAHGEAAVCPSCQQRDSLEDAVRIAQEQAHDAATRAVQASMAKGTFRSEFVKFEAQRIPRRTFKWHAAKT